MVQAEVVASSASLPSDDTDSMRIIHHNSSIIFFGESDNAWQVGDIAFHAENTIHDDQFRPVTLCSAQLLFERLHVVVAVFNHFAKGKSGAVNNRGMYKFVDENIIVTASQGGYGTQIGLESGTVKQYGLFVQVISQRLFQFDVNFECAVEETRPCTTGSILLDSPNGCLF